MENTSCFDFIFKQLELKQLFAIQAELEKSIKEKIKELDLPEMEVAKLKHQAINAKKVLNEQS